MDHWTEMPAIGPVAAAYWVRPEVSTKISPFPHAHAPGIRAAPRPLQGVTDLPGGRDRHSWRVSPLRPQQATDQPPALAGIPILMVRSAQIPGPTIFPLISCCHEASRLGSVGLGG